MNKKAFTLMELMVVVLIIAILAAIALPVYNAAVDSQNNQRAKAMLETINNGMERFAREYPDVQIPFDGDVFIFTPPSTVVCNYNGQNLSATDFVAQMVACGYIPRYNYGNATHEDGDGFLDYRFGLQDPRHVDAAHPLVCNGDGYVYMQPKPGANVGNRFCMPVQGQDNTTTCIYRACIGPNGTAVDNN